MVKIENSGDVLIKKWMAIISLIFMIGSLVYSVSMSLAISPLDRRVEKVEVCTEEQKEKLHELDKMITENKLHFEHINKSLEDIKKQLIEMNK